MKQEMEKSITLGNYKVFDDAYKFFNNKFFDGKLPECLITLQRRRSAYGYYSKDRFSSRDGNKKISELAMNPDTFKDRTDIEILSTLVHEMVHVWQIEYCNNEPKNYHDKEFAQKMQDLGLMTSSTGEEGGKRTGANMSHYIVQGGNFEIDAGAFLLNNKIEWDSVSKNIEKPNKKRKKNKFKFTCPECMQEAWGKKDSAFICGICRNKPEMLIEDIEDE